MKKCIRDIKLLDWPAMVCGESYDYSSHRKFVDRAKGFKIINVVLLGEPLHD